MTMQPFPIKKRRQAAEDGERRYYTGKPCSKGHDAQRYTATGVCVRCANEYVKGYNKRLTKQVVARLQGHFSYALHPDDHAAALAYCQALDLQRGRLPSTPTAPAAPGPIAPLSAVQEERRQQAVAFNVPPPPLDPIEQRRREIAEHYGAAPLPPHLPPP